MKKLLGLMFALALIVAPLATYAQVESNAGSMKIGVHMDIDYLWSQNNQHHPTGEELGWEGYSSITAENLDLEVTGKVGDRVSYKVLEALVYSYPTTWYNALTHYGAIASLQLESESEAYPVEAYVDLKVIDQLKFRIGKQMTPTLLANTPVHMANTAFTTNIPLIANDAFGIHPVGFNELFISNNGAGTGYYERMSLPGSVTGISTILSFSGLELSWTLFDSWLDYSGGWGFESDDYGYDWDKSKGNNLALTYAGEVGPGKLTARAFWNDESVSFSHEDLGYVNPVDNSSWGLGAMYNAKNFFLGAEYANDTVSLAKKEWPMMMSPHPTEHNGWQGCYVVVGGNFSSFQPVYRFDWIDYSSLSKEQIGKFFHSAETESWHTFAVNYKVNDNMTLGLDYVIKAPSEPKHINYPMINELSVMAELNTL